MVRSLVLGGSATLSVTDNSRRRAVMGTCSHVSWSALWSIAHLAKSLTGKLARNQKGPLALRTDGKGPLPPSEENKVGLIPKIDAINPDAVRSLFATHFQLSH